MIGAAVCFVCGFPNVQALPALPRQRTDVITRTEMKLFFHPVDSLVHEKYISIYLT